MDARKLSASYEEAVAVTPHDTNLLTRIAKALYVGGTGTLKITTYAGQDVTFTAVPVGIFPVMAKRVFNTGTTATNIIALN